MNIKRLLCVPVLAMASCFAPKYGNGDLKCAAGSICPSGFHCVTADNRCYKTGFNPDLAGAVRDMASNRGDLTGQLGPSDLAATITLSPPAPAWTSEGGGAAAAASGVQIGVSVGGSLVGGTATAASGATLTFGYFSSDTD